MQGQTIELSLRVDIDRPKLRLFICEQVTGSLPCEAIACEVTARTHTTNHDQERLDSLDDSSLTREWCRKKRPDHDDYAIPGAKM